MWSLQVYFHSLVQCHSISSTSLFPHKLSTWLRTTTGHRAGEFGFGERWWKRNSHLASFPPVCCLCHTKSPAACYKPRTTCKMNPHGAWILIQMCGRQSFLSKCWIYILLHYTQLFCSSMKKDLSRHSQERWVLSSPVGDVWDADMGKMLQLYYEPESWGRERSLALHL